MRDILIPPLPARRGGWRDWADLAEAVGAGVGLIVLFGMFCALLFGLG